MRVLLSLLFMGFLIGCESAGKIVNDDIKAPGQTIRLSRDVTALYDKYRTESDPFFFAASKDGLSASYTYCDEAFNCWSQNARRRALEGCQSDSVSECVIIANSYRIVWPGEIVFSR